MVVPMCVFFHNSGIPLFIFTRNWLLVGRFCVCYHSLAASVHVFVFSSGEFFASLVVMPLSCVVAFSADLHMSMQLGRLRSLSCSRVFLISSSWMLHTSLAFSRFSVIAP